MLQTKKTSIIIKRNSKKNESLLGRIVKFSKSPKLLLKAIKQRLIPAKVEDIDWNKRVDAHGAYSVIDSRHSPDEYDYVTNMQKDILFPLLRNMLNGHERNILDYGCGVGRFTKDLSLIINGKALGFDPTKGLIDLCKASDNVYFEHDEKFLYTEAQKFDIVWICLVLGGISDKNLNDLAKKITNILNPNGLLFLVESTGFVPKETAWRIRKVDYYLDLFAGIQLEKLDHYYDADQEISIYSGRKLIS